MKNYIIIGGSSGIGAALTKILAAQGNKVYTTFNKTENFTATAGVAYHQLNILEDELNLNFVPDTIDGLVYCPGSINLKPFKRIKPSAFVDDFNLQVVGAIKVIQELSDRMKTSKDPSIVLFSTVAVSMGYNFHTQVATSKGAIEGLSKSLAAEFAPRIRVNCVAPSLTDTPLASKLLSTEEKKQANADRHPLKKIGTANDIAEMAAFLLSDKASWISGQVLHVDGGMSSLRV
ncbi:MAG: SDR family oxidoreductase [Saprospiraceae bacterium]|nr:SDR family oxidoreductase [Saprospiraceae bacterium]